jgi:TolB-like protein/DNA-binding winged helix-turn-helix (wHTH) protein/Flp pilus assembly protein TadD
MPVSSANPQVVCFGLFELDLGTNQLRRQGRLVRLQEQPLQLLALLVHRPGEVVEREEIRQKLWAQDTFVEFDDSVNHAIRKVREALGDSATSPRFIETVPKQGYRFIAPVKVHLREEPDAAGGEDEHHVRSAANHDVTSGWARGDRPAQRLTGGFLQPRRITWAVLTAVALGIAAFFLARIHRETPRINSLAVLPLENLSGDSTQEYFSDGVTEAIITDLGKIRGIRVISRTSVMPFKNTHKTLPQIAQDLNVDALIEGGIVRSGGRVRITAQLVGVNPEQHIWAASYEREASDIIALQREIAEAVGREIRATVSGGVRASRAKDPVNPQAYELYLRGREHLNYFYSSEYPQAVEYLNRAIALDPNYAPAHASLAMAYAQMAFLTVVPRGVASQKAKEAVAHALDLDDSLAEAHTASAYTKFLFEWDWRGPEIEFRRSLELNPNSADAHLLYSLYLTFSGRFDDAIRENQLAIRLDPLNSFANFNLGWTYFEARRYAEGISFMQELQRRRPDYPFVHHHLAELYAGQGNCSAALAEAEHESGFDEVFVYAVCGRSDRALKLVHDAENEVARGKLDPMYPAWMYSTLGQRDEAFRWLDRAIEERSPQVVFIRVMPELDNIRSDPRFEKVLQHVGAN